MRTSIIKLIKLIFPYLKWLFHIFLVSNLLLHPWNYGVLKIIKITQFLKSGWNCTVFSALFTKNALNPVHICPKSSAAHFR